MRVSRRSATSRKHNVHTTVTGLLKTIFILRLSSNTLHLTWVKDQGAKYKQTEAKMSGTEVRIGYTGMAQGALCAENLWP